MCDDRKYDEYSILINVEFRVVIAQEIRLSSNSGPQDLGQGRPDAPIHVDGASKVWLGGTTVTGRQIRPDNAWLREKRECNSD